MSAPKKGIGVILAGLKGGKASNDVDADPMADDDYEETEGEEAGESLAESFAEFSSALKSGDDVEGLAAFKALVRACKGS